MDIEEVVSDTFIRLWQAPEKFDPMKGTLKTYLALMTKSLAINKYRQNQRNTKIQLVESQSDEGKIAKKVSEDDWEELYQAIGLLEEPYKEIIIRRFFYDKRPKEIRKKMKMSSKEVDNFLYRGKCKLKKILGDREFWKEM